MKKKLIIVGFIVLLVFSLSLFCYFNDNIRFKISYEFLNLVEDGNGKIVKVNIPFDNKIEYTNGQKLISILKEGTGIVYFGYNSCPWCRNIIESLIAAAKEKNIDKIYYVNIKSDFSDIRNDLYDLLDDYLEEKDGVKGLSSPDVFFIKNGKVMINYIGANGIVEFPYDKKTKEEKEKIKQMYIDGIEMIK